MDSFEGDLRLTTAAGDEQFVPLGSSENEPPYPGEIIYKDDKGAVCRCWNWREAQRTMLTEKTKNAFLCIELVDEKGQTNSTRPWRNWPIWFQSTLGYGGNPCAGCRQKEVNIC